MYKTDENSYIHSLRELAESSARRQPVDVETMTTEEIQLLVHELQVHQIQLEMQNEELLTMQEQLHKSRIEYTDLYHLAPISYITLDKKGMVRKSNQTFSKMIGMDLLEIIDRPFAYFLNKGSLPAYYLALKNFFSDSSNSAMELELKSSNNNQLIVNGQGCCITSTDNEKFLHLSLTNITELKNKEEKIRFHAEHDTLTGLANRKIFNEELKRAYAHAIRNNMVGAIIFVDIDHFKHINDHYGHTTGDHVLKYIASRFLFYLREDDIVARFGGDEFVILISSNQNDKDDFAEQCVHIVEKLSSATSEPIKIGSEQILVSASFGIRLFPEENSSASDILAQADHAMYQAKLGGRNRYHFFDPEMHDRLIRRIKMISDLSLAIEREQLSIVYQPILDANNLDRTVGYEALIRWTHPELGLVTPEDFIPLIEDNNLIMDIENWVIENALNEFSQISRQQNNSRLTLSINISPRQFGNRKLINVLEQAIKTTGLLAEQVCIEITERTLMQSHITAIEILEDIRVLGLKIAIDDFGMGYSNLSNLGKYPIDTIKIDQSFLLQIENSAVNRKIIQSISALAKELSLNCIAEGVESAIQETFLQSIPSIYAYQGYRYGEPASYSSYLNA